MRTTAKFGAITNNQSLIDRFKTQLTENIGRSQIFANNKQSQMNVSQLQNPVKQSQTIIEGTKHVINGDIENQETIYRCPICDRLRAICPYKSYKTYQYCQKCVVHQQQQKKHQRPRIFSNATPSFSKQLSSTFAETRGHSISHGANKLRLDGGIRNMAEVDRVRFVQSNNIYPLRANGTKTNNISQYQYQQTSNYTNKYNTKKAQRPRSTTQHVIRQPTSTFHHVINQQAIIPPPPNIQQIIFYPVIHNKIVYKSAQKPQQNVNELGQIVQIKRSRYQSNYSQKKSKRQIGKTVSDFLFTTKPDQILTPVQFKKLADSIYRETNPNVEQY